jgi:diacylglycerol kinase (ATP)
VAIRRWSGADFAQFKPLLRQLSKADTVSFCASFGDNQRMTQAHSDDVNPQKSRTGINRILHATNYSLQGLRAGWGETAFRQEALGSIVLLPLALWVGRSWLEIAVLVAVVVLVLITELLNTGIETAIDRIGPEWHDLSKRAKDMGSAAVLLSLLLCAGVWAAALYSRFIA